MFVGSAGRSSTTVPRLDGASGTLREMRLRVGGFVKDSVERLGRVRARHSPKRGKRVPAEPREERRVRVPAKHGGERRVRVLAKHGGERLVRGLPKSRRDGGERVQAKRGAGRLGRLLAKPSAGRLGRVLAKHGAERLARAMVVALVLLLGGGTAAALALLAPGPLGAASEPGGAAPSRFAVGQLDARRATPRRGGAAYYRKTSSRHVPASTQPGFMALYREAARAFGVSWRLLASIHRQETAFSTAPTTYHGLNPFGCCAGPMQFNVTNGPPSTWALYRMSFRKGERPRSYPHPTRKHPSIYDDFDAIMAAGALLRDSGATEALDGGSWSAAYAYYGHDLFGVEYASQVLGRARGWERDGFCLNCPVDDTLIAAFEDAYGADARLQLLAAERSEKQEKRKKRKKHRGDEPSKEEKARRRALQRRSDARERARSAPATERPEPTATPRPAPTTPPPPPAPASTEAAPQPAPPPPDAGSCTRLDRLLGCGG